MIRVLLAMVAGAALLVAGSEWLARGGSARHLVQRAAPSLERTVRLAEPASALPAAPMPSPAPPVEAAAVIDSPPSFSEGPLPGEPTPDEGPGPLSPEAGALAAGAPEGGALAGGRPAPGALAGGVLERGAVAAGGHDQDQWAALIRRMLSVYRAVGDGA